MGGADSGKERKMKRDERRAFVRVLLKEVHPERTYYTREEWIQKKGRRKTRTYEEIRDDAITEIKNRGFQGYTVEDLRAYVIELDMMCKDLEVAAREKTSVNEAYFTAARKRPSYFNESSETAEQPQDNA